MRSTACRIYGLVMAMAASVSTPPTERTPAHGTRSSLRPTVHAAWIAALLVDRMSFPEFTITLFGSFSLVLAIVALLRRNERWAAGAIAVDTFMLLSVMPDMGNHVMLRIVVNGLLLTWFLPGRFSPLPALRVMVVLLYVLAAFHKLNSSFLDPAVSCASFIADTAVGSLGLGPNPLWIGGIAIALTILFEAGLPLALLIPRTRQFALLLGLTFHTGLAFVDIGGVASFSAFMFAGYFAFAGLSTLERFGSLVEAGRGRLDAMGVGLVPALVVALSISTAAVLGSIAVPGGILLLARVGTVILGSAAIWLFLSTAGVWSIGQTLADCAGSWRKHNSRAIVAGLLAVLLVIAGALPYLGGRTQASFSMFSNLRTESEPNHLFFDLPDIFGYQEDLVSLGPTTTAKFVGLGLEGLVVPEFEIARQLEQLSEAGQTSGTVSYVDTTGARTLSFEAARERFPAPNPVEGFLYRMRDTEPSGPVACRH